MAFTVTAFVLHVVLNIFMVSRFTRGIKTLAQVGGVSIHQDLVLCVHMYIYQESD